MNMQSGIVEMPALARAWSTFQSEVGLRPIRDEADYERISKLADALADEVGDDESHPLYSMFDLALELISRWEDEHVAIPDAEPREVLRSLLDEHHLKQKDLEDEGIASQSLVSEILSGRRAISKRLAKTLAERFHVEVGAFL